MCTIIRGNSFSGCIFKSKIYSSTKIEKFRKIFDLAIGCTCTCIHVLYCSSTCKCEYFLFNFCVEKMRVLRTVQVKYKLHVDVYGHVEKKNST